MIKTLVAKRLQIGAGEFGRNKFYPYGPILNKRLSVKFKHLVDIAARVYN